MLETGKAEHGSADAIGVQYKESPGGETIGWCDIHPPGTGVNKRNKHSPAIWATKIAYLFQGIGHGTKMMKEVVELIKSMGYDSAYLIVYCDNAPAIKIYRRAGFVLTHYRRTHESYTLLGKRRHRDNSRMVMTWYRAEKGACRREAHARIFAKVERNSFG